MADILQEAHVLLFLVVTLLCVCGNPDPYRATGRRGAVAAGVRGRGVDPLG